jgi:hypothetical protein
MYFTHETVQNTRHFYSWWLLTLMYLCLWTHRYVVLWPSEHVSFPWLVWKYIHCRHSHIGERKGKRGRKLIRNSKINYFSQLYFMKLTAFVLKLLRHHYRDIERVGPADIYAHTYIYIYICILTLYIKMEVCPFFFFFCLFFIDLLTLSASKRHEYQESSWG